MILTVLASRLIVYLFNVNDNYYFTQEVLFQLRKIHYERTFATHYGLVLRDGFEPSLWELLDSQFNCMYFCTFRLF